MLCEPHPADNVPSHVDLGTPQNACLPPPIVGAVGSEHQEERQSKGGQVEDLQELTLLKSCLSHIGSACTNADVWNTP